MGYIIPFQIQTLPCVNPPIGPINPCRFNIFPTAKISFYSVSEHRHSRYLDAVRVKARRSQSKGSTNRIIWIHKPTCFNRTIFTFVQVTCYHIIRGTFNVVRPGIYHPPDTISDGPRLVIRTHCVFFSINNIIRRTPNAIDPGTYHMRNLKYDL